MTTHNLSTLQGIPVGVYQYKAHKGREYRYRKDSHGMYTLWLFVPTACVSPWLCHGTYDKFSDVLHRMAVDSQGEII